MPVALTYPGVYVQELPSGVRTIVGVSTSIGMFLGRAKLGELMKPVRCLSLADFERAFSLEYAKSDLARAVKLFFDNGGADCYVMRRRLADVTGVAPTVAAAQLTLKDENLVNTLQVTAKSAGLFGNDIRLAVNYNTASPEGTFNLEVFRWVKASNGALQKSQIEFYPALSMDVDHPRYVEDIVNLNSKLVRVDDPRKAVALAGNGLSVSGYAVSRQSVAVFLTEFLGMLTPTQNKFRLSVGGRTPALIDLSPVIAAPPPASVAALETLLRNTINAQLPPGALISVVFQSGPGGPGAQPNAQTLLLTIEGVNADVYAEPASSQDLAGPLMLGTAQGGIEIPRAGGRRPAPNGVVMHANFGVFPNAYTNFGQVTQAAVNAVRVAGCGHPARRRQLAADLARRDRLGAHVPGQGRDRPERRPQRRPREARPRRVGDQQQASVRPELPVDRRGLGGAPRARSRRRRRRPVVDDHRGGGPRAAVRAGRECVRDGSPADDAERPLLRARRAAGSAVGVLHRRHHRQRRRRADAADYEGLQIIDQRGRPVQPLVLPRTPQHTNATIARAVGPASTFCEQRRAFLLIDPPANWVDRLSTIGPGIGVNTLRVGLVKQLRRGLLPEPDDPRGRQGDRRSAQAARSPG